MNHKIKKYTLVAVGLLAVALGTLGIFLPVLPTTPFLLLAAYCFTKSSDRLHDWLLHHKVLGKYIYNYTVHRAIPLKTKIIAITTLWLTMGISMYVVGRLPLIMMLAVIGTGVTIHLLRFKTLK